MRALERELPNVLAEANHVRTSWRTACVHLCGASIFRFSRKSGLGVLLDALRQKQTRRAEESELLLASEVEKRATLSHELETANLFSRKSRYRGDSRTITNVLQRRVAVQLDACRRRTAAHFRAHLRQRRRPSSSSE